MNTIDRLNTLAQETQQTIFETAIAAQKQNAQLTQQWLGQIETNQETGRKLAETILKQAQEAQTLWVQLMQESLRNGVDTVVKTSETQLREMENLGRRANGATRKGEGAAAAK